MCSVYTYLDSSPFTRPEHVMQTSTSEERSHRTEGVSAPNHGQLVSSVVNPPPLGVGVYAVLVES